MEEVAEEVAEHLPEGSELKRVVNIIENIAEETAKDAQLVDNFIDKVATFVYLLSCYLKSCWAR